VVNGIGELERNPKSSLILRSLGFLILVTPELLVREFNRNLSNLWRHGDRITLTQKEVNLIQLLGNLSLGRVVIQEVNKYVVVNPSLGYPVTPLEVTEVFWVKVRVVVVMIESSPV